MSEPFLGEIRLFSNSFAPSGWVFCDGQILPIMQNQALFSLLGTVYGGDGRTTFALPDLRGRVPVHVSQTVPLGHAQGEESHALTQNEMPAHSHLVQGSSVAASSPSPQDNVWGTADLLYGAAASLTKTNTASIATVGGGESHTNMQPYLALNFCIALEGIFPSRN